MCLGRPPGLWASATSALKVTLPILGIAEAMIQDAAVFLGVPAIWVTVAVTTITVAFVFALLYLFLFRPPPSS